jgi:hypothetical protein
MAKKRATVKGRKSALEGIEDSRGKEGDSTKSGSGSCLIGRTSSWELGEDQEGDDGSSFSSPFAEIRHGPPLVHALVEHVEIARG